MISIPLNRVRSAWARAAKFPDNKEEHYKGYDKIQEFDDHVGKTVLEYGCGGGADAMSYLRRGCAVWYVDIVLENVAAAGQRIEAACLDHAARGYWLDASDSIPFDRASFDVANACGVLHHIVDPLPVVREIRRVMKPGGLFYCMLYAPAMLKLYEKEIAHNIAGGLPEYEALAWCTDYEGAPYARVYTMDEGRELLTAGGFQPVSGFLWQAETFCTFKARAV